MKDKFDDNLDDNKYNFKSNKKDEENFEKFDYNSIVANTKSIKEKLNLLEKNINYEINNKNQNKYSSNSKLDFSDKKSLSKSSMSSKFYDNNTNPLKSSFNLNEIKMNNEIFKNKLKSIENKLIEDKKNKIRFNTNVDKYPRTNIKEINSIYQDETSDYKISNYLNDSVYNYNKEKNREILESSKKSTKRVNFNENDFENNDDNNDYLHRKYNTNDKDLSFLQNNRNSIKSNFMEYNNLNLNKKNDKKNYLSKTIGYYDKNEISKSPQKNNFQSSQVKFSNKDMKLDYTNNELKDLDKQIMMTKENINKCLSKTEVSLIEGKNDVSIISKTSRAADYSNDPKKNKRNYESNKTPYLKGYSNNDSNNSSNEKSKKIKNLDKEMPKSPNKINNYKKLSSDNFEFIENKNRKNPQEEKRYNKNFYSETNNNYNYNLNQNQNRRQQQNPQNKKEENSGVELNISGIADDLISIQNEESIKEKEIDYQEEEENLPNFNRENKINKKEIENKKINLLYDKQLDSYQQYLNMNKQLSYKSTGFINPIGSDKKQRMRTIESVEENNFLETEEAKRKKYDLIKEKNISKISKNEENYTSRKISSEINSFLDNSERGKENYKFVRNEQKLRNIDIDYDISPIRSNKEKVKFNENENENENDIDQIVNRFESDRSNKENYYKEGNNYSKKLRNYDYDNIEEYDNENEKYISKGDSQKYLQYKYKKINGHDKDLRKYETEKNSMNSSYYNKKSNLYNDNKEKDYYINEKNNLNKNDLLEKIPRIVEEFQDLKSKNPELLHSYSKENPNKFFNLHKLANLIDMKETNSQKQITEKPNFDKFDILHEADKIINNHTLKLNDKKIKEKESLNDNVSKLNNILKSNNIQEFENKINFIFEVFNKLPKEKIEEILLSNSNKEENEIFDKNKSQEIKNFANSNKFEINENQRISFESPTKLNKLKEISNTGKKNYTEEEEKNLNTKIISNKNKNKIENSKENVKNKIEINSGNAIIFDEMLNDQEIEMQKVENPFKKSNKDIENDENEIENLQINRKTVSFGNKEIVKKNNEVRSGNKNIQISNSGNKNIQISNSENKNYNNISNNNAIEEPENEIEIEENNSNIPDEKNEEDQDFMSPENRNNSNYYENQNEEEEMENSNEEDPEDSNDNDRYSNVNNIHKSAPARLGNLTNMKKNNEKENERDKKNGKVKFFNTDVDDKEENSEDLSFENSNPDPNQKYLKSAEGIFSDTPMDKFKENQKIKFSKNVIYIDYVEDTLTEEIKVTDKDGKPEKHKKFNYLKYLNKLTNNRWKPKKAIHYYYNGLRDDKIPKKLIKFFKKSNNSVEQDKETGLKKLNEFLEECNNENNADNLEAKNKSRIVRRNLDTIHEIEELRKSGQKFWPSKSKSPNRRDLNSNTKILKSLKSSDKINFSSKYRNSISKIDTGLNNLRKLNSEKNFNKKKLNEFNINSEPSNKGEKENALKDIISNINLEESL